LTTKKRVLRRQKRSIKKRFPLPWPRGGDGVIKKEEKRNGGDLDAHETWEKKFPGCAGKRGDCLRVRRKKRNADANDENWTKEREGEFSSPEKSSAREKTSMLDFGKGRGA